jgi:cytoskeletal protein RodZ
MSDSLGQRLKFARQERRLSIEQAAEVTRIRPHYLQALEADDYSVMPSAAQARGFLRSYASFLNLDFQAVLDEIQASRPPEQVSGPLPQVDLAPLAPETPARPPVVEKQPPLWRSWLGRLRKPEPTPEPDPVPVTLQMEESLPVVEEARPELVHVDEPLPQTFIPVLIEEPPISPSPAPVESVPAPKPRGRRKKVEVVEPTAAQEPPTRKRRAKKMEDVPATQEPPTRVRRKQQVEESEPVVEPQVSAPEPPGSASQPVEQTQEAAPPEAEISPDGQEQAEVQVVGEARPSLFVRIGAFVKSITSFRVNRKKTDPPASSDVEVAQDEPAEAPEPAVQPEPDPASEAVEPTGTPEQIFAEIGGQLQKRRELLSLTLEEIERHIHVRAVFAKALEDGDFDQLPSMVQTRGMLTTYATFLDLDTDALLLRFADALQARHRARYPEKANGDRKPTLVRSTLPSLRSFMAGDMLYGLVIVLMVMVMVVWGLGRVFAQQAERVALPTAPSIADVLVGTPLPTSVQEVTLIPAADTPFALAETETPEGVTVETPTPNLNINVALNIIAAERTFMRVLVDGQEAFNGRVLPGTAYPFEAAESIQVLTGNGAALRVTYNGRDLGLLGTFGEVVDFIYTIDSIVTPTPPAPPTATNTPNVTSTPSPTPSPTPTSVSTPTATATPLN